MGLHHKLGVILIGIKLCLPSLAYALVIEPLKVDSSQGEPLYLEIPYYNAESKTPVQVSLAQSFDRNRMNVSNDDSTQLYNFYVRQNDQGTGVIVITSNRPINQNNIDLVLRIEDGHQTRIQQIKTDLPSKIDLLQASLKASLLQPKYISSEKEIPLNLAAASSPPPLQLAANVVKNQLENTLTINKSAPPSLNNTDATQNPTLLVTTPAAAMSTPNVIAGASPTPSGLSAHQTGSSTPSNTALDAENQVLTINITRRDATANNSSTIAPAPQNNHPIPVQASPNTPTKPTPATSTSAPIKTEKTNHTIKANDSLWRISHPIAQEQRIPVHQVMRQIKAQNPQAFVNGNSDRLKQGVVLTLPEHYNAAQNTPTKAENIKTQSTTATETNKTQKKTATKQTQAHMSLIAANTGTLQGSDQNSASHKIRNELTFKVKQQRERTLGLQNNVRQLDQQLKGKEQRLAFINARLAEIEQLLKSRQVSSKNSSLNRTSGTSATSPDKL